MRRADRAARGSAPGEALRRAPTSAPAAAALAHAAAAPVAAALVAALALAAGCSDQPSGADGGTTTEDAGVDGGSGSAGLHFQWRANPAPEDTIRDGMTITEVELDLRDIRAIGDAAPGDARTWRASLGLQWSDGVSPKQLVYDDAPPGLYASLEFRLDGNGDRAFRLQGMALLDDGWSSWEIESDANLAISVPLSVALEVGDTRTVPIDLDLAAILGPIDWQQVDAEDGDIKLEDGDPQMPALRARFAAAFSAASP